MPTTNRYFFSKIIICGVINQFEIINRREELKKLLKFSSDAKNRSRSYLTQISTRSKQLKVLFDNLRPEFIVPCFGSGVIIWGISKNSSKFHIRMRINHIYTIINIFYTITVTIATLPNSKILRINSTFKKTGSMRSAGITKHISLGQILTVIHHSIKKFYGNTLLRLRGYRQLINRIGYRIPHTFLNAVGNNTNTTSKKFNTVWIFTNNLIQNTLMIASN